MLSEFPNLHIFSTPFTGVIPEIFFNQKIHFTYTVQQTEKEDGCEELRVSLPGGSNSSSKSEANSAYYVLGHFAPPDPHFRTDIIKRREKKGRVNSKSHHLKCAEFPQNVRF